MEVNVDRDEEAGERCQWMLHQNAGNGPEWSLATAYEQQEIYVSLPRVSKKNPCEKIKISGHCARHNEDNEETVSKSASLGTPTWSPKSK